MGIRGKTRSRPFDCVVHGAGIVLALVALLGLEACGSRVQTRRKIEATEGTEETAGHKDRRSYRELEGSGYSAEDAAEQLAGD